LNNVDYYQAHPNPTSNWSGKVLKTIHFPNIMAQDVPNNPPDYYTCQFRKSKLSRFLGADDRDNFFQVRDRQAIVYEILATTTYGKKRRAEVGIERLLEDDVYTAAYPLHDVRRSFVDCCLETIPRLPIRPRAVLWEINAMGL
jgi:anoctamin-7